MAISKRTVNYVHLLADESQQLEIEIEIEKSLIHPILSSS